jgi:hypothetical protein
MYDAWDEQESAWGTGGAYRLTSLHTLRHHQVRVRIEFVPTARSEAYALVEVLAGKSWRELHRLLTPLGTLADRHGHSNSFTVAQMRDAAHKDRAAMIQVAETLLVGA